MKSHYNGMVVNVVSDIRELMDTWNSEKNPDLDPHKLKIASLDEIWWKCRKCGHEWFRSPRDRVRPRLVTGCPSCSGRDVNSVDGHNSFAKMFPDFVQYWDRERNGDLRPENVCGKGDRKIWFRCRVCGEPKLCNPRTFVRLLGCSKCNKVMRTSSGERMLYSLLHKHFSDAICNDHELLGGLEIDILIPSKRVAIEYDGDYWHTDDDEKRSKKHELLKGLGYATIRVVEYHSRSNRNEIKYCDKSFVNDGIRDLVKMQECFVDVLEFLGVKDEFDIVECVKADINDRCGCGNKNSIFANKRMMDFWLYDKNDVDPRFISAKSNTLKCWFRCPRCGRDWHTTPEGFCGKGGCYKCSWNFPHPIVQITNTDGIDVRKVWKSTGEAGRSLGLDPGYLSVAAHGHAGNRKTSHVAYGSAWFYLDDVGGDAK